MAKTNTERDTSKADEVLEFIKLLKEKHQPKLPSLEELEKLLEGGEEAIDAFNIKQLKASFCELLKETNVKNCLDIPPVTLNQDFLDFIKGKAPGDGVY